VLLQLAAYRVGHVSWFEDYALLGDDIVIADTAVAKCYYQLMVDYLGVDINLSKSLVSEKGVVEFAKRLCSPLEEFTPLGPANIVLSLKSRNHLPSVFLDGIGKGNYIGSSEAKELMMNIKPELIRFSEREKFSMLWSMLAPFGFITNMQALGPSQVEGALSHYSFDKLALLILEEIERKWEDDWILALSKTMREINHLATARVNW